jgi:hypothetical protein
MLLFFIIFFKTSENGSKGKSHPEMAILVGLAGEIPVSGF